MPVSLISSIINRETVKLKVLIYNSEVNRGWNSGTSDFSFNNSSLFFLNKEKHTHKGIAYFARYPCSVFCYVCFLREFNNIATAMLKQLALSRKYNWKVCMTANSVQNRARRL